METYMIGYDLNTPGQDYDELIPAIKKRFKTFLHRLDSTWIVRTNMTAEEIRDYLLPYIDYSDELLVAQLTGEAAWYGFGPKGDAWLQKNL